jgi:hypothetical protein
MIIPNCTNCKRFEDSPCEWLRELDLLWSDERSILPTHCSDWVPTDKLRAKADKHRAVSQSIDILNASLACYERQYDNVCTTGSSRCITCDFNCKQGTLSERKNALRVAIDALEKEKLE